MSNPKQKEDKHELDQSGAKEAIQSVKDLDLSQEDTEKILGGNAIRLMGLDE